MEIGCSLGHTSYILSNHFNHVTAVDNHPTDIESAKKFNKDKKNVTFVRRDVYSDPWNVTPGTQSFLIPTKFDVVFIDCVHDYVHVQSDILNSIKYFNKPLLIFDDYGLFPTKVKKCIDDFVENNRLKVIKKIGHKKGVIFPNTAYKVLKDYEGIICQVV